jgi:hypothetical protein
MKEIWYELKHLLLALILLPFLLFMGLYELIKGESLFDSYNDYY